MKKKSHSTPDITKTLRTGNEDQRAAVAALFWTFVEEMFPQMTGYSFRGVTISQKEEGWTMVIKAWSRKGEPLVTFAAAGTAYDLWQSAAAQLAMGALPWSADKYAK